MAFTEYYCQSGGSNLNAGSTTNNTAAYTSTNGGWNGTIFTPTDGSTPSSSISVGDIVSVYLDAATLGVWIGRVTAVGAGVNGTITTSATARAGSSPSSNAAGRSIKAGGAWKGPNGADASFPFSMTSLGNVINTSGDKVRINLKNDATYSVTATGTWGGVAKCTIQGYTSTPGDLGKATIDAGTSVSSVVSGMANMVVADLIVTTSITSGSSAAFNVSAGSGTIIRVVVHGARGSGFNFSSAGAAYTCIECEAYDNNKANGANEAGFKTNGSTSFYNCISHDNAGSNASGFYIVASSDTAAITSCISESNGKHGIELSTSNIGCAVFISHCDFYNNGGDGINNPSTSLGSFSMYVKNCNFIKNAGAAINVTANGLSGELWNNGYGSGSQANGSADVLKSVVNMGADITYDSGVTPWVDPANGDFRINLTAANWAGRGAFTETAASYAGTVGFPDIGAAQSKTGTGGTFSKESSYGFSQ